MTSTVASTGKAAKAQSNFGKKLGNAVGTVARYAGAAALLNVGLKVFRALTTDALKEAIKFEKSLANLSAVAGVSGDEMKKLGENALKVAGSTKFTADEIVKLQTELSKLGFTAEEVVKSTLPIAFAAQALGSPLESTAALVGKVRNQFGLLVEQTTEIADVLVTSINESALSFESFGTAMQYIGPIATSLGLSLQQTAGAMGVLADSGFTASRIGTGLRGILTEIGKTSGDAEKSLQKLAEQNINLAEAAELVGKRNAAQLITLLKNLDAIEESSTKYYQQGRAVESASKQINTFSGQVDLLNAALKEFQIGIGNSIVESDFLIDVMSILSQKASETALAFKVIAEVGFEKYDSSVQNVVEGADVLEEALALSGKTVDDYDEALELLSKNRKLETLLTLDLDGLNEEYSTAIRLFDTVEGLAKRIEESVQAKKDDIAITKGQTIAQETYGDTVDKIIQQSIDGLNVNNEIADSYDTLRLLIEDLDTQIEKTSGLRQLQLKAERNVYKQMQEQLNNSLKNESDLLKIRRKSQRDALKLRLDDIKRQTKEELKQINERARIETSISKTAEERADIEAERTKLVSDAYVKQSAAIRDLSKEFETQIDVIKKAALASDDLAEILTSDVISDVKKAITEYGDEVNALRDKFANAGLGNKEFKIAVEEQEAALRANINSFTELIELTPELKTFFDNLINATIGSAQFGEVGDEINRIQDETAKLIKQVNEQAKIDSQIAGSKAAASAVEAKRLKDVSDLYKTQETRIVGLSSVYENQRIAIDAVADSSNELAQILTSDIVENVIDNVDNYTTKIIALNKAFDKGEISQKELTQGFEEQEKALIENVEAFSALSDLSPEVEAFFKKLIADAIAAKSELNKVADSKSLKERLQQGLKDIDWGKVITEAADATAQAIGQFNDVALENTKGQAEQELDVLKNKFALEEEILNSQLNNQLITESQFRKKKTELRKAEIAAENEIEKKLFDAQKKRDKQQATSDYLVALANIIPSLIKTGTADPIALQIKAAITGALATGSYAASLAAIGKRKFYKKFADGGVVNGPSHEEGGVPFSVQGNGGYEMEGGEYVINKRATSMHKDLLDRINQSGKTRPQVGKVNFAQGGLVSSPVNESVDYLKAIAEATTSTAIGVSKPVRAYVADKDLQTNSTERRIRDRNDRI